VPRGRVLEHSRRLDAGSSKGTGAGGQGLLLVEIGRWPYATVLPGKGRVLDPDRPPEIMALGPTREDVAEADVG
jgi:hypothetical protein